MTLQQDVENYQKEAIPNIPEDILNLLMGKIKKLKETGIENSALKKGDKIPSFTLKNAVGKEVSSDDLLNKGRLVISFYRGAWCPYCNLELHALQNSHDEIKSLGAQLVSISPNIPDSSLSSVEKHSLKFEVLSDTGNKTANEFGLVFKLDAEIQEAYGVFGIDVPAHNDDDSWELPVPATYVVDKDGTIIDAFVSADYTKRMEPSDIINSLK